MKQEISDRFDLNIARVKSLVAIYSTYLAGSGAGRRAHQKTDVLRAATVFLHASLEDVLRSLAYWKLPTAAAAELDKIPFAGGTTMKITLGSLAAHRGKAVSTVIKEAVDASLERSNYNNASEVCGLLTSIGLDITPAQPYLATLELAMARRHQIVHRADANLTGGKGNHSVASISTATLTPWIANTEQFVQAVLNQV